MVSIQCKRTAIAKYRELLVAEWTSSFPEDVLKLITESIGPEGGSPEIDSVLTLLMEKEPRLTSAAEVGQIVARIANATRFIEIPSLPELSDKYSIAAKPAKVVSQAIRLAISLTLTAHTNVSGRTEFLMDVQSLAAQAAIHFLLPELKKKHEREHALLLHALVLFAIGYSAHDPAHCSYLMSLVYGYLGDEKERYRALYASFRLTSPEDHSYLTKAQDCWSELLDQGRFEEAETFLLSLSRSCLREQQDEVRAMFQDAFKHILQ